MSKILILGAGIYQVPLIAKAKSLGHTAIVVSRKGNYPGFQLADKVYYEDTTDTDTIVEIARAENVESVCTAGTDIAMLTLGTIVETLGLKGVNKRASEICTNKYLMKEAFNEAGITSARYAKAFTSEDVVKAFQQFGEPIIVKAVDSSGSRGIVKINAESEIADAVEKVQKVTKQDYFIVEEFIKGTEFGAQAFVQNNELFFVMLHGDFIFNGDAGVPVGHYVPYYIPDKTKVKLELQIKALVKYLAIDSCAMNLDFILKDDKVYFLEVGARSGATCLAEMVSVFYDVDYYEMIINASLGKQVTIGKNQPTPNAASLLVSDKSGTIINIINHNNPADPAIIDVSFDYSVGEKVNAFNTGPDRIGQVIVKGNSLEAALAKLKEVKDNINIVVMQGLEMKIYSDFDNTLIKENLENLFMKFWLTRKESRIRLPLVLFFTPLNMLLNRVGLPSVFKVWTSFTSKQQREELINAFLDSEQETIHFNEKVLKFLKDSNCHIDIVSGGYEPIIRNLLQRRGMLNMFDNIYGSEVQGFGILMKRHPFGRAKNKYINFAANSIGIADAYSDRFYLAKCKEVLVVNPDKRLNEIARKNNWGEIK